ncbi:AAA family ATPase [Methanosarcina mazei]|jgi:predicted ATPase|uniref:Endonuclease GajA/Old nuclease/RecF-like AAA domain-containing protein n=1 Tax=Methanosarcina mazei LYC TaxID=1434114 RepID=A0A0E3WN46_METMZ|nr:AAA family ATPase [Methanosarcina mazei]AKB68272.1 hypothetical protein MSMAL_1729 [Methanosarcina mazei LYC]
MNEFEDSYILYVDNFRGFKKNFIPLKKVNFLMGENSTGKTSILSLINLIHHPSFWFSKGFHNSEINFGSFYEISNKEDGKKSFSIGLLNCKVDSNKDNSNKNEKGINLLLLTFYDDNGIPSLSEYSYSIGDYSRCVKISKNKKTVLYKELYPTFEMLTESKDMAPMFKQWIDFVSTEIKKSSFNKVSFEGLPPYPVFIQSIVENDIVEKESKKKNTVISKEYRSPEIFEIFNLEGGLCWIAPIRAKPRRVYDNFNYSISPEGEHAPYVLKNLLSSKKKAGSIKEIMDTFGKQSGLFDTVKINNLGRSNVSPFEINIDLNSHLYKIYNVGYGVSQVLPIVVDLIGRSKGTLFAIQQPEVHLHPKAQASLGELIYNISSEEESTFLVETHSEYLVNRFRYNMYKNKNKEKTVDSQVLFFEKTNNGNEVHVIEIKNNGKYSENQPDSFNDFFIDEELNLLEI